MDRTYRHIQPLGIEGQVDAPVIGPEGQPGGNDGQGQGHAYYSQPTFHTPSSCVYTLIMPSSASTWSHPQQYSYGSPASSPSSSPRPDLPQVSPHGGTHQLPEFPYGNTYHYVSLDTENATLTDAH